MICWWYLKVWYYSRIKGNNVLLVNYWMCFVIGYLNYKGKSVMCLLIVVKLVGVYFICKLISGKVVREFSVV